MPFTTHIQNKWQLKERKTLWEWRENRREKKKQFNCNRNQEERSTIKRYVRARSASLMISQKWYLFARFFFFKTANNTSPSAKIQVQYVEKKRLCWFSSCRINKEMKDSALFSSLRRRRRQACACVCAVFFDCVVYVLCVRRIASESYAKKRRRRGRG